MAGPFGSKLHSLFSKSSLFSNVITLGHSSSSSLHWMSEKNYKLSGGVFHSFNTSNNINYPHPNPTHWREKVDVPKLKDILAKPSMHSTWPNDSIKIDTMIIELGANDARSISNSSGVINSSEYQRRQNYVISMIDLMQENAIKCYWIGAPDGLKKTQANQTVLYKMLKEAVLNKCEFFSSNHFKAEGCDGVHFSCASQRPKAIKWANEVFNWVSNGL